MSTQLLHQIIFHQKQVLHSLESLVKIFPQTSPPYTYEEFDTVPHFPLSIRPYSFLPQKSDYKTATQNDKPSLFSNNIGTSHPLFLPRKIDPVSPLPQSGIILENIKPEDHKLSSHPYSHQEVKQIPHIPRAIRPCPIKQKSFSDVVRGQHPAQRLAGAKQLTHSTQSVSLFSPSFPSSISIPSPIEHCLSTSTPTPIPLSLHFPPLPPFSENKQTIKSNNNSNKIPAPKHNNKFQLNKEKISSPTAPTNISKQKLGNASNAIKFPNLKKFSAKGRHFREQIRQMQPHNAPTNQKIRKQPVQEKNKSSGLNLLLEKNGDVKEVSLESKKHATWIPKFPQKADGEKKCAQLLVENFEKTSRVNFEETKNIKSLPTYPLCFDSFPGSFQPTFSFQFSKPQKGAFPLPLTFPQTPSLFTVRVFMCEKLKTQSTILSNSVLNTTDTKLSPSSGEKLTTQSTIARESVLHTTDLSLFNLFMCEKLKTQSNILSDSVLAVGCVNTDRKTKPQTPTGEGLGDKPPLSPSETKPTQMNILSLINGTMGSFPLILCPNGHISFKSTNFCRFEDSCVTVTSHCFRQIQSPLHQIQRSVFQESKKTQKEPVITTNFPHHCPNGHISFSQTSFCRLTAPNQFKQEKGDLFEKFLFHPPQKTLVLRLKGGGGIEVPIPEKFVPKIDFELVENQDQARERHGVTFLQLLQRISLDDPSFTDPVFYQIDLVTNKINKKILEEFLKSFFTHQKGQHVTILLIFKTQNIPQNPLALLRRDIRPFVQISLLYLTSVHLNLQPGKPGIVVAVLSKIQCLEPISQVYFKNGIVQPLSGTNHIVGVETTVLIKNGEPQHKQIFAELFSGLTKAIDTLIVCGKKAFSDFILYRFIFFTKREKFSELCQLAEESWEREDRNFWVADINLLDTLDSSFELFLISGASSNFIILGSKKVSGISKETSTKVLSIIPKNNSSLLIVKEKGVQGQDFITSLIENSLRVTQLGLKGAREIQSNPGLMVYPIPNSKDGQCTMSLEELQGIIKKLLQTDKAEQRQKGVRVFCDAETLATWRNFEGFLGYQKVRMCKEKEKESERMSWWTSLRGLQKDDINERRKAAFLRLMSPTSTNIPCVKRRRGSGAAHGRDEC